MLAGFICPDGEPVTLPDCMKQCRLGRRCLTKTTLEALAVGSREWDGKPHVTQLLNGTMMEYLRITNDYYRSPQSMDFALLGSTHHKLLEDDRVREDMKRMSEVHLSNDLIQGTVDLIELEDDGFVMTDYKTWGSYRVKRAKGLVKRGTRGDTWFTIDPEQIDLRDAELQLNMYRIMAEEKYGIKISRLQVQVTVRDGSTRIAKSYGVMENMYLLPIQRLTDSFINGFIEQKSKALLDSVNTGIYPPICSPEERWHDLKSGKDRRCERYCEVAKFCPHGQQVLGVS